MTDPITAPESPADATPSDLRASMTRRWNRFRRQVRRRRAARNRSRRMQPKILTLTLLILLGAFAWSLDYVSPASVGTQLSFDELSALAEDGRIIESTFLDEDAVIEGVVSCAIPRKPAGGAPVCDPDSDFLIAAPDKPAKQPKATAKKKAAEPEMRSFWLPYPKSDLATAALLRMMTEADARVDIDQQTYKAQVRTAATFLLPLMVLANLFALLFTAGRSSSSGIGDVIVFGSMGKGKVRRGRNARVTFADVAGTDEAVTELQEVVDYLRAPERYELMGADPPKGVLMVGPPGCGKTLIAKAAAGEADVPFFSVAGAEFVESLVGVGAARVRDLFRKVRAAAPAIVFIDELDAAGRKRGTGGGGGGTDEREQTLNQLLVEMDGFDASSGIVVIGATNRPDILDPALLRPGRFDRHITIDRPDRAGREEILHLHAKRRKIGPDVDFSTVARRTPGFSGADLANVINEAALLTVRQSKSEIAMAELLEAVERVLAGPQRRGLVLTVAEKRRASIHEAGHAIVTAALGKADDVHRVSILARGRAVAATTVREDAALLTRTDMQVKIVAALAGVAAEEMALGEPSTGSESDLELATDLARDMVARYGMSPTLGRVRRLAKDSEAFIAGDVPFATMSALTQQEVDTEIRKLLDRSEAEARRLLVANEALFVELVGRIEQAELLEGAELTQVLDAVKAEPVRLDEASEGGRANGRTVKAKSKSPRSKS